METTQGFNVIAIEEIRPSYINPRKRFDKDADAELQKNVEMYGILQPILARPLNGHYEIVAGERRYRAAMAAGLLHIPAVIRELDDKTALEIQVIENLQRRDLHPLEEAEGYEALVKHHGLSAEEISAKVCKSISYVFGTMKLCALVPAVRKMFYEDRFNRSVALLIARMPGELQDEAAMDLVGDPDHGRPAMSYRDAIKHIQDRYMLRLADAGFDLRDEGLVTEAGSCMKCEKRTGNQRLLFPDVKSADICTDPACFKAKKDAFAERTMALAKESGKKILSERESKKVFPKFSDEPQGYVRLDEGCMEDPQTRTYKQLVKSVKNADVVVARNPHTGEVVTMVSKAEAARIRKQIGIKREKPFEKATVKESSRQQEQLKNKFLGKIVEAVVEEVRLDGKMAFMRSLAEAIERDASVDARMMFMRRRDPEIKRDQIISEMEDHLKVIGGSELPVFCVEMLLTRETEWCGPDGLMLKALCNLYDINLESIRGQIEAEVATNTKPDSDKTGEPKGETKKSKRSVLRSFEVRAAKGKRVTVTVPDDISEEDRKAAQEGMSKIFGGGGK